MGSLESCSWVDESLYKMVVVEFGMCSMDGVVCVACSGMVEGCCCKLVVVEIKG